MTESASPPGPAVFTPLHRWLGREAERLSMELLDAAVAAGLEEHADLDFKLNPPVSGALMQSDLPKDIAAMANSGGGMLLLGVSDSGSRASDAPGVAPEFILDTCLRDLRRVAINRVSPPVSDISCNTPEPSGEPPYRNPGDVLGPDSHAVAAGTPRCTRQSSNADRRDKRSLTGRARSERATADPGEPSVACRKFSCGRVRVWRGR